MTARLAAVRAVAADPRAELLVAGRTSAATLAWLERHTAARVRAWVEERGLRAASRLAIGAATAEPEPVARRSASSGSSSTAPGPGRWATCSPGCATPRSSTRGSCWPTGSGPTRRRWPPAEDRFASDLLLSERVADPWLRALTASAASAPIPILLGGHTLVGPGSRLVVGRAARGVRRGRDAGPPPRPAPDLDAVGQDEALVARIRDEIARDGPITFARFMELALYDPDGGYYRVRGRASGSRR